MSSFYFVVKSTVQTLVLVTRDSGALIICTFLSFVHVLQRVYTVLSLYFILICFFLSSQLQSFNPDRLFTRASSDSFINRLLSINLKLYVIVLLFIYYLLFIICYFLFIIYYLLLLLYNHHLNQFGSPN